MSDQERTEPLEPPDEAAQPAQGGEDGRGDLPPAGTHRDPHDRPDPVRAAKDPDVRAKLLLATAALTLVNLLLLLVLLGVALSDPDDTVVVDGENCVIREVDGENVLFCQR